MPIKTLLLDVGGTFIKCAGGREIPISSEGCREDISAAFSEAVSPFCDEALRAERTGTDCRKGAQRYGIAVAIPGPFDYRKGIFLMKHKFAAVFGETFRDVAGIPDNVELRFMHDVNGMLAGEMTCGNGRGYSRVALVSLGTGLGFAMSIDGHILKKETGSPLVSIFNRPYRDGILEDYASKRGFLRAFERLGGTGAGTVKDIAGLAAVGDGNALATFREIGAIIGEAISPILEEYRIECLLFGGQISRSFHFMEKALYESLCDVEGLECISQISDFGNATFNGLRSLF